MSTADAMNPRLETHEKPLTPESWGKLGMWIFLVSDAMTFGTLIAGYGAYRMADPNWPNPAEILGLWLTAFMTFLLICSSVTMVFSLDAIKNGDRVGLKKNLLWTVLGGSLFLVLQAYEWTHLITSGMTLTQVTVGSETIASLFGTTFYIMTGFHGLHVFGGVVYLTIILLRANKGVYHKENTNEVEIAGWYWHFVDLVWILIFTFVYLL